MNIMQWLDFLYALSGGLIMSMAICFMLGGNIRYKLIAIANTCLMAINYWFWWHNEAVADLFPDIQIRQVLKTVCMILFYVAFVMIFKAKTRRKVMALIAVFVAGFAADFLTISICTFVWRVSIVELGTIPFEKKIFFFFISVTAYVFMEFIAYLIFKVTKIKDTDKTFLTVGMFLFFFCCSTVLIATVTYNQNNLFSRVSTVYSFLLIIGMTVVVILILRSLNEKGLLEQKLRHMEETQILESDFNLDLQKRSNEVREIQHDINDQLQTVKSLLNDRTAENVALAKKIITVLDKRISSSSVPVYTENIAINATVFAKAEYARKHGVAVSTSINLPAEINGMEIYDLNLLFINLLNNAISACATLKTDSERKEVVLKASVVNVSNIVIRVENPYSEVRFSDNGRLKTTKRETDRHGIGLLIIENIAKKYNGTFITDCTGNIFKATVSVYIGDEDSGKN